MNNAQQAEAISIMNERFGRDSLISLVTINGNTPSARIIDGYYMDGSFYSVTYAISNKMLQIKENPAVAVCGKWFTGHGVGEDLGHVCDEKNAQLAAILRDAFRAWYSNGDVDESDPNTCILRIRLTDGVLFTENDMRYQIDFTKVTK